MCAIGLGVDLGTSRIKCALVNVAKLNILQESSADLGELQTPTVLGASERSISDVQSSLETCLEQLDPSLLSTVQAVQVCGQMHGCVLWSSEKKRATSNLFTWQDQRCDDEFLSSLPQTRQPIAISSGYGCATLAWLQKYCPAQLIDYDCAGTIMDYVVWMLVGGKGPIVMSDQNAVSWGYFDQTKMCWETDL